MIFNVVIMFFLCSIFTIILTPYIIKLANHLGAIDKPDARKAHASPTPRLGGIGIFISFIVGFIIFYFINPNYFYDSWILSYQGIAFAGSIFLIMVLGFFDDLYSLKPAEKFTVQFILASIIYYSGINISVVSNPFSHEGYFDIGIFSYPVTVLWIVGITNALNLIDGLDGLAVGIGIIISLTMAIVSFVFEDAISAMILILLAGALFGMLKYNFNPAKIFIGDSGSLFIGFAIAILSIKSSTKSTAAVSFIIPILAIGLPITDMVFSMIRRFVQAFHPEHVCFNSSVFSKMKSMFSPDKKHIHHMLMNRGFSHKNTVLVLYMVCFILGLLSCVLAITNNVYVISLVLINVPIFTSLGIKHLKYQEMSKSYLKYMVPESIKLYVNK